MNLNLHWVPASATAVEAARIMRDRSLGFLLVSGSEPGELAGVLTDRDLAIRVCVDDKRAGRVSVAEIATTDVVTCGLDEKLTVAEQTMIDTQKSRIVIVDEIGRPVGVLSLTDILNRDRGSHALRTARGVLAREAGGPHQPVETIRLTPSTPEDEARATRQLPLTHGGSWGGSMKEFP
jgi:signal-transduction protein with cAMP-binding, CBS, and nucleotidyltransferase domain